MHYTIVGLRETGELSVYDRSASKPSLADVERICHAHSYTQLLVLENKSGGERTRYEFDSLPRAREVPMRPQMAKEEAAS